MMCICHTYIVDETLSFVKDSHNILPRPSRLMSLIDEIDGFALNHSKFEGEVEKRVVAQLLTLIDGFARTEGVTVLAATNRPDPLDPALRRPGWFDREVQYRVPDRNRRLEILIILTREMPLDQG